MFARIIGSTVLFFLVFFFFNDTATTEIYTLSLHDALPISETFRGYPPETGWDFLVEAIARHDYGERGIKLAPDEIVVSDGAKSDTGNIQEIFGPDCVVALSDPVYPAYLDVTVMGGRAGTADQ